MTPELQAELDDARSLLYQIELVLDADHITEAHFFASELVETLYRAKLIDLRHPDNMQEKFPACSPSVRPGPDSDQPPRRRL